MGIMAFKMGLAEDYTAEAAKPVDQTVERRAIEADKSADGNKV